MSVEYAIGAPEPRSCARCVVYAQTLKRVARLAAEVIEL